MKSYTDLEQSKKLAEILPLESADNYYSWHDERYYVVNKDCPYPYSLKEKIPCWSLASLLGVIPEGIIENYYTPNIQKENGKYSIAYGDEELLCEADNPVDACYEMIIKLNELKML
jgi:hypothetical protein